MNAKWMMWVDSDKSKSPEESVLEAVEYYQRKYGVRPNRVQAHLTFPDVAIQGVMIERTQIVLKDHLHLTVDTEAVVVQEGGGNAKKQP